MARPTTAVRLRDVVPQEVGQEVVRLVTDHAVTLLLALDPSSTWSIPERASTLRWSTQLLAAYAQRGLPATDWPHHGAASDAIVEVCTALYSSAGEPDIGGGALDTDVDETDAIGVVLLAAHARVCISQRQRVPVREIAALASVDPDHVRLLARKGELALEDGAATAKEARRWLSGRGIEGV